MAELKLTEAYEKKRNHLLWFSGISIVLGASQYYNPHDQSIDVFKSGILLDVRHVAMLLLAVIIYQAVSFWFEDHRVSRLNSEVQRRTKFDEPLAAIKNVAAELSESLRQKVSNVLADAEYPEVQRTYDQIHELRGSLVEAAEAISDMQERMAKRAIDDPNVRHNLRHVNQAPVISALHNAVARIDKLPIAEHEASNVAVEQRARIESLLGSASERLETDFISEVSKLHTIRADLLLEDKFQLFVVERATAYLLAGAAAIICLAIILR